MESNVATLALAELKAIRARFDAYEEYAESMHKQGFRPEVCIHGTSQWVDYDVICGGCEDGDNYFDYTRCAEEAIAIAKEKVRKAHERLDLFVKLQVMGAPIHEDMMGWISEPMKATRYAFH